MKSYRNKRFFALLLALVMLVGFAPGIANATATESSTAKQLMILHTNDEHGQVEYVEGKNIGYPLYKNAIKQFKEKAGMPVLVINAGDATQGTNLANFSKGASIIDLMNDLGVEAFVPGNHEYDFGNAQSTTNHSNATFPWYASNIFNESDKSLVFKGGEVIDVTGADGTVVKVGLFGLATPETKFKAHPDNTKGLFFPPTVAENVKIAQDEANKLRAEGADFVVAISHLGTDLSSEVRSQLIAEQVTGIDVIVDGHSHSEWPNGNPVGNSTIVSSGDKLRYVGQAVLKKEGTAEATVTAKLLNEAGLKAIYPDLAPDASMLAKIDAYVAEMGTAMNVVIGKTATELDGVRNNVRSKETNLGNLITDAMLKKSGADVVLTNGGGIRASIDVGDITKGEVFNVLPFGNMLYTFEVTGQQVLDALNFAVSDYPNPQGKFPHIAGMKVEIVEGTPTTVKTVKLADGTALDIAKKYKLATNDFVGAGGDGFTMFAGSPLITTDGSLDVVVQEYVAEITKAAPAEGFTYVTDGRLTVVTEEPEEPVQTGLVKDDKGLRYIDPKTEEAYVNRWKTVDGKTYYFGADTYAVSGLQTIAKVKHYFGDDNVQYKNRWKTVDGKTYYFNANGVAVTGLQTIANVLHFFGNDGVQFKDRWITVDGKTYYMNKNGTPTKGLVTINGVKHYFGNDGVQFKDRWITVDGKTYYMNKYGTPTTGLATINGVKHFFGADGVQYKNRWITVSGKTYLFNQYGVARTGLYKDPANGATYYFDSTGVQLKNGTVKVDGKDLRFNANGVLIP